MRVHKDVVQVEMSILLVVHQRIARSWKSARGSGRILSRTCFDRYARPGFFAIGRELRFAWKRRLL